MKKLFLSLLTIGLFATSCQDTNTPAVDNTAFGSSITADHQRIGTGQNVKFSVPFTLVPGATGIGGSKVVVNWVCNNGSSNPEDKNEGGVSSFIFNWNHIGQYTISCNTEYFFDNKQVTLQGPELEVTVEHSSFVNSFWGDNVEQVKKDNPAVEQAKNNNNVYGYTTTDNTTFQYTFTDGKLSQGIILENVTVNSTPSAYKAFGVKALYENKMSGEAEPQYSYIFDDESYTPTTEEQAALDLYSSEGIFSATQNPDESELMSKMITDNGLILIVDGKFEGVRSYKVAILGVSDGCYQIAHYYFPL